MIRAARPLDVEPILAAALAAFAQIPVSPPRPDLARAIIADCVARSLALVADREGGIAGSVGLRLAVEEWSGARFLTDRWTFNRGSPHELRQLVRAARSVAAHMGIPLRLGLYGADPRAARLYSMIGGKPIGGLFAF